MRVARCPELAREIKSLCKNRPFVQDTIEEFERLLINDFVPHGDAYGELRLKRGEQDARVYKFKVIVKKSGGGKQSGLRYVCEFLDHAGEQWALCLGVYLHSQGDDSETHRREDYRARFGRFDPETKLEEYEQLYR